MHADIIMIQPLIGLVGLFLHLFTSASSAI